MYASGIKFLHFCQPPVYSGCETTFMLPDIRHSARVASGFTYITGRKSNNDKLQHARDYTVTSIAHAYGQ